MLKNTNKQKSVCHSCTSVRESIHYGSQNKFGMTECGEYGRSMIEMLGVLAVIGVLSVGGIAGYTSAMNKHRANELLYQASMRATSCAAQIAMGNTPNVDDFGTYDGYTFTASQDTANNQFSITINGKEISETVCHNIENALPSDVTFESTDCGTSSASITLTYADGTGTGGGEPGATLVENCASGTGLSRYYPYRGDITNERTEAGNCHCPNDKPQWNGTECKVADTTSTTCTVYDSQVCPDGYYCQFSPWTNTNKGFGTCTKITGVAEQGGGHWVGPELDWWSANSWCISKGSTGIITYATVQSEYECDKTAWECNRTTMINQGLGDIYWTDEESSSGGMYTFNSNYMDLTSRATNDVPRALCE